MQHGFYLAWLAGMLLPAVLFAADQLVVERRRQARHLRPVESAAVPPDRQERSCPPMSTLRPH